MSTLAKVTCLCGSSKDTVEITSDLPSSSITCSCDICRYCTGVLFLTCLRLKDKPSFVDGLESYKSSENVTRFFCRECGSHVCCMQQDNQSWNLCAGVVDEIVGQTPPGQLQAFMQHEFVGSTLDGGLAICLADYQGKAIRMFLQGPNEEPVQTFPQQRSSPIFTTPDRPAHNDQPESFRSADETLRASCHCGGVRYTVTRPSEASKQCSSPWPDLIVPHSAHSDNPEDVKWWLRDRDTKYLAGTCACRSCRLATGSPIQTWAFVPKANIRKMDGTSLEYTLGTLKQYKSSDNTYREFCSSCGATVFWHCDERPDLIDVSVGLLRASEGSRAENWLKWHTKRVSFKEHAFDSTLAAELERGLQVLQQP